MSEQRGRTFYWQRDQRIAAMMQCKEDAYEKHGIPTMFRMYVDQLMHPEWRAALIELLGRDIDWNSLGKDLAVADRYRGEHPYPCAGCKGMFAFMKLRLPWTPGNSGAMCRACLEQDEERHAERLARRSIKSALTRARDCGLPARLTEAEWERTLAHFDNRCAYCGESDWYVVEHVMPLDLGGGTTVWNCVPACYGCNSNKKSRTMAVLLAPYERGEISYRFSRKRLLAIQQWLDQQDDIPW